MSKFLGLIIAGVIIICATTVSAQPPWAGKSKFGAGKGQFGDPAKMADVRHRMMRHRRGEDQPDVQRRPGPPPWAGKGKMRGHRGPQRPFPHKSKDFKRGDKKSKVSGHHRGNRGRGWQHGNNKPQIKGSSIKRRNNRGNRKGNRCGACACQDCPNNKR